VFTRDNHQFQRIRPSPRPRVEVLTPRSTLKLEDHPLSTVRDCLFNIFTATLRIWRPSSSPAPWGLAMPWWQGTHLTQTHTDFPHHTFIIFFITFFPQPRALLPLDSRRLFRSTNQHHQIQLATYFLPFIIRVPELAPLHIHPEDGNCNVCRNVYIREKEELCTSLKMTTDLNKWSWTALVCVTHTFLDNLKYKSNYILQREKGNY
jgi:hypothetical protein